MEKQQKRIFGKVTTARRQYFLQSGICTIWSSSFGGGMGRLREVCGAVSGMFMAAGMLYGYDTPGANQEKSEHYKRIQELAKAYETENGSIVCRELLGLSQKRQEPVPEKRTDEYYQKRPCPKLVSMAAAIMEAYIAENPLP